MKNKYFEEIYPSIKNNIVVPNRQCKEEDDIKKILIEAVGFCTRIKWVSSNVKDWYDSKHWNFFGDYIKSKENFDAYTILKAIFITESKLKYWQTDCRNYILFCHFYLIYKCLDKHSLNEIYKEGFKLGLPVTGRSYDCNWIKSKLFFSRGTTLIKSYSGLTERYDYDYRYNRLYLENANSKYSFDNLSKISGLPLYKDVDEDIFVYEEDILNNLKIGSRISFTCIPASETTDYKNENILYVGDDNFSAVPYCTEFNPTLSLKSIKKRYSEACRLNLIELYNKNSSMARAPYIHKKRKFRKRQVVISSYEILETILD
ncbi:hypothetical protein [Lacinutrix cladophorae]